MENNERVDDFLAHYGILGMKWGVRNSETLARYARAARSGRDKLKSRIDNIGERSKTKRGVKELTKRKIEEYDSKDYEIWKTRKGLTVDDKKGNITNITNEDLKKEYLETKPKATPKKTTDNLNTLVDLEKHYIKEGMDKKAAKEAAKQNLRTKKILKGIAIGAGVAVAGTIAYKLYHGRIDKIIKSGTIIQHISGDATKGVHDAFYGAINSLDKTKYKGMYGAQVKMRQELLFGKQGVYNKSVKVLSDIKQASTKTASQTFQNLVNTNANFKAGFQKVLSSPNVYGPKYDKGITKAIDALNKGKPTKKTYEIFQAMLVDHSSDMQPVTDQFYKALKDKGYNAIRDIHDVKYSGYKAINPIITFGKDKVSVIDVKEIAQATINKNLGKTAGILAAQTYTPIIATFLSANYAIDAKAASNTQAQRISAVKKYRQEHPNTKQTYTEIIKMLEGGK